MTDKFKTKNYFNTDPSVMIIDVLVVLEILDCQSKVLRAKYEKIVIGDYLCFGHPEGIELYFLQELLDLGYSRKISLEKFSDNKKYEGKTDTKYHSAFLNGFSAEDEGLYE